MSSRHLFGLANSVSGAIKLIQRNSSFLLVHSQSSAITFSVSWLQTRALNCSGSQIPFSTVAHSTTTQRAMNNSIHCQSISSTRDLRPKHLSFADSLPKYHWLSSLTHSFNLNHSLKTFHMSRNPVSISFVTRDQTAANLSVCLSISPRVRRLLADDDALDFLESLSF